MYIIAPLPLLPSLVAVLETLELWRGRRGPNLWIWDANCKFPIRHESPLPTDADDVPQIYFWVKYPKLLQDWSNNFAKWSQPISAFFGNFPNCFVCGIKHISWVCNCCPMEIPRAQFRIPIWCGDHGAGASIRRHGRILFVHDGNTMNTISSTNIYVENLLWKLWWCINLWAW